MDKENFFTKLRRVAAYTEKETAKLKTCMQKPVAVRSSAANPDEASARLALEEILYDAQKIKENANKQISCLQTSSEFFQEILDSCSELCQVMGQQVDDLECYLHQYGYKKYGTADYQTQQLQKENKKKKEVIVNVEPEQKSPETVQKDDDKKLHPCTPPKDPVTAPPVDPNRTPQLSDFGISQWTLDSLANKLVDEASHDLKASGSFLSSVVPSQSFTRTPQHSKQSFQNAPFTNQTILVTPGMFGNQGMPTQTPSQFIDTKSYLLDSPIPPELLSVKKAKPTTLDLRVTRRQDITSPEPKPPAVTSCKKDIHLPVPPSQIQVPPAYANTTPPMPPCLAPQATNLPLPAEPTQLAQRFPTSASVDDLPAEPVQISQHVAAKTMPVKPVQLAEEFGYHNELPVEPVQLAAKFGQGVTLEHPQLLADPITPKGHPRMDTLVLEDDMPLTPELTVTSHRFMDIKSFLSGKHADQLASPNLPLNQKLHVDDAPIPLSTKQTLQHPIPPVTEAEFTQVLPYLQRLLPIDVINQKVADINAMLANKQDASFIGEAEIQSLQLGPKTKAFVLLLAKLGRLSKRKRPDSDEQVYYVIA